MAIDEKAPPREPKATVAKPSAWRALSLQNMGVVYVFLVLCIFLALASRTFLLPQNLINIVRQAAVVGLLSIGMTFLLATGNFDLSVGAQAGFSGVVILLLIPHVGLVPALIAPFAVAYLIGGFNGTMVTKVGVNSLVTTLGTLSILKGALLVFTDGRIIQGQTPELRWFADGTVGPFPIPVVIFLLATVIGEFFLNYTRYGRHLCAVGGNKEASLLAGLRVDRLLISDFMLMAAFSSLAGIVLLGRVYSANPVGGIGLEFIAITAAVLGGTSIFGGEGSVWKTAVAVLLLQVLGNGFNILNVNAYYQNLIQGVIMIGAVTLYTYQRRKS
jgi:ribose/xylose/arabinose/galactoside ABC-type transport system permease subunit